MTREGGGFHTRFDVTLSCGHVMHYPSPAPSFGDILLCRSCDGYRVVQRYVTAASTERETCQEVCHE